MQVLFLCLWEAAFTLHARKTSKREPVSCFMVRLIDDECKLGIPAFRRSSGQPYGSSGEPILRVVQQA